MQMETRRQSRRKGIPRRRPAVRASPVDADEAACREAAAETLGQEEGLFLLRLAVANRVRMWADCPHEPCRRARACRGDDMVCVEERRDELKRKVLQEVVWLLCTTGVSSDEFYDYLEEVTSEDDEDSDRPDV